MTRTTAFASCLLSIGLLACSGADLTVAAPIDDDAAETTTGDAITDVGGEFGSDAGNDAVEVATDAASEATPTDAADATDATVGADATSDAGMEGGETSDAADAADGANDANEAGDAGPPSALFGATALDFGLSDCGGAAPSAKGLKVINGGLSALHVTAAMQIGTSYSVTAGAVLTIDPGSNAVVEVTPAAVPASTAAATEIDDTLTLTTDDPMNASVNVPVKVTAAGATLTLSPATVAFGSVSVGTSSSAVPFTLSNSGNQSATVAFGAPSDAQFVLEGSGGTIGAGAGLPATTVEFTPWSALTVNASIPLTVTGAICGASVSAIPLSGAGVTGAATVSGDVSFGTGGFSPCGGAAAAAQTITIGNSGGAAFTWTAVLAGTAVVPGSTGGTQPMYALSSTGGTINPGDPAATITVTSQGIPFPSAVPGSYDDAVTITTNIPGDTPKVVHLNQAAQGAILAVDTTNIAFGSVANGTSQSSTFKVTNNGNADANVTVGSSNNVFSVSPATATKVTAGDNETVSLTYTPADASTQTAHVTLGVGASDVICQPLPSAITASGSGLSGGVGLDVTTLDFGLVNCGATASAKTFTLTNTGTAAMTWNTALGKGSASPYTLSLPAGASPTTGTLAAGASLTFTVTPASVPGTSAVTPNLYGDVVTLTTNIVGDTAHTITLKETAQGAILAFVPTMLDLGQVPLSGSSSGTFALQNTGNASATVTLATSSSMFALTGLSASASIAAPGGVSTNVGVTFSPGSTAASESATVTPATSDVLCGALPAPMQLAGTGVTGHVSYSPSALDFGLTNCGTKASAQTVTFSNVGGTAAYDLTSATFGTTAYTLSPLPTSTSPVNVPIGGSVTLTVIPAAIPTTSAVTPNLYADTLTVTTDISGDTPKTIAISQTAQGAILAFSATSLTFGGTVAGAESTTEFAINNTGNAAANVVFGNALTSVFDVPDTTIAAATQSMVTARFTPNAVTTFDDTANVTVDPSTVLCQPLTPTSMPLSGTGTAGALAKVSPKSLNFGDVALTLGGVGTWCGTTAPAQTVTVTSLAAATAAAPVTYSLGLGTSSPYTVTLTGTNPLPAGGSVTLTIAPAKAPLTPTSDQLKPNGLKDTLTINSGIAGDAPYSVDLNQNLAGVFVTPSPTSISFPKTLGGSETASLTLTNVGDVTGTIAIASTESEFTVSPDSLLVSGSGGSKATTVTFKPTLLGSHTGSLTFSVTSVIAGTTTPMPTCGTLPTVGLSE